MFKSPILWCFVMAALAGSCPFLPFSIGGLSSPRTFRLQVWLEGTAETCPAPRLSLVGEALCSPASFPRGLCSVLSLAVANVPILILGNKIDRPEAISEERLREMFGLYGQTTGKVKKKLTGVNTSFSSTNIFLFYLLLIF